MMKLCHVASKYLLWSWTKLVGS